MKAILIRTSIVMKTGKLTWKSDIKAIGHENNCLVNVVEISNLTLNGRI